MAINSAEVRLGPAPVAATAQPYHRLARTARHRWWRPIVGALLILVGLLVVLVGGFSAASIVVYLRYGSLDLLPRRRCGD